MSDKNKLDQILECQAKTQVTVNTIDEKVDRCLVALYGSAEHPENGLTVKVDRLEQTEKRRSKVIWAVVLATVGLLCEKLLATVRW